MTWSTNDIPELDGTRVILTGVTGGLGSNAAAELAKHGASLIVTARDSRKTDVALNFIRATAPEADVEVLDLDLADLTSVARAAAHVVKNHDRIDLLINNAGIMATPEAQTADGFEMQIGTNHIGHFAFTAQLWPALRSGNARIVTVSSLMHTIVRGIDLDSVSSAGARRRYSRWRSYGESKLANLLFALELDRRVRAAGIDVASVAAHPGYASTNLTRTGAALRGVSLPGIAMHQVTKLVGQPAAHGAWPILMAATDPAVTGGQYVGPGGFRQLRGRPRVVGMTATSRSPELAAAVWEATESATGLNFLV